MKHLKFVLTLAFVAAITAACAGNYDTSSNGNSNATAANASTASGTSASPAAAPTDELAAARVTYNAACVRCHKETGEGGVVEMGEDGTLKVPSFKEGHTLHHTDAQFARQIAKGGDGMPAFEKRLTPEQIGALVRFVRREFQAGLVTDDAPAPTH
ncbi:MAG TPA: c-type cytochrome [Pyrinomonadaceae bacterium]|jgi:mono/diheme cytochrome c family protein